MKRRTSIPFLSCLIVATVVAFLAPSTAQAARAVGVPTAAASTDTARQPRAQDELRSSATGQSYLWDYVVVTGAVLLGLVVLGLWGDVAIGAVIVGICGLAGGAGRIVGKASRHVRMTVTRQRERSTLPVRRTDGQVPDDAGTPFARTH